MKKLVRFSIALGNSLLLNAVFASPASAQVATGSATPTPTPTPSTTSALPQAGSFPLTLLLVFCGIMLVVLGVVLSIRQAGEEARV